MRIVWGGGTSRKDTRRRYVYGDWAIVLVFEAGRGSRIHEAYSFRYWGEECVYLEFDAPGDGVIGRALASTGRSRETNALTPLSNPVLEPLHICTSR